MIYNLRRTEGHTRVEGLVHYRVLIWERWASRGGGKEWMGNGNYLRVPSFFLDFFLEVGVGIDDRIDRVVEWR